MKEIKIGIVGPCAAGKTTLVAALKERGYQVRHIAQEHSYVPDMWQRLSNPECLIYLDVSYQLTKIRRKMSWTKEEYQKQVSRLANARNSADLYINTDGVNPDEVLNKVLAFLNSF